MFIKIRVKLNNIKHYKSGLVTNFMSLLIYCATPSRLKDKTEEIMDLVTNEGNAPFHPFQAFPFERFEGNLKVGRDDSMEWCLNSIGICNAFYLFGVSDGTLQELVYAKTVKPVFLHLEFDSEWEKHYEILGKKYDYPLEGMVGNPLFYR